MKSAKSVNTTNSTNGINSINSSRLSYRTNRTTSINSAKSTNTALSRNATNLINLTNATKASNGMHHHNIIIRINHNNATKITNHTSNMKHTKLTYHINSMKNTNAGYVENNLPEKQGIKCTNDIKATNAVNDMKATNITNGIKRDSAAPKRCGASRTGAAAIPATVGAFVPTVGVVAASGRRSGVRRFLPVVRLRIHTSWRCNVAPARRRLNLAVRSGLRSEFLGSYFAAAFRDFPFSFWFL